MDEKTVYTFFDEFLEKFKDNESLFSEDKVFTKENIQKVIKNYVENEDTSNNNFTDKIDKQLVTPAEKKIMANAIWLWSFAVGDITVKIKNKYLIDLGIEGELNNFILPKEKTILHAGQHHKTNKFEEMKFIIVLFKHLIEKKEDGNIAVLKKTIIEYIVADRNQGLEIENRSKSSIATQNILLHLCSKEDYEPIANYNHKKTIVDTFEKLIAEKEKELPIDDKIKTIKKKLTGELKVELDNGFYSDSIRPFWNFKGIETNADFSEFDALKYKKQIIFYGPPGTSKTYKAKELAETLIKQEFIKRFNKQGIKDFKFADFFTDDFSAMLKNRIFNLQLHPNYSYEDFIVGMKIKDNTTKWEKGYLLKLIDKIKDDTDLPYVIILDEINRVDLSRLFGELFSAIENRGKPITLSAIDEENKEFENLTIPENLYFIGTMNQIDFSLERIDFALRRRFVWYFYGYNENRLREIIDYKVKLENLLKKESGTEKQSKPTFSINNTHIEELIKRASDINKKLEKDDEFGKEWEIGHTFFAEIVDICRKMHETNLFINSKKENKLTSAKEPVEVLWNISIKPMLEAYCGNLDKDSKKKKLEGFEKLFLGK